jgi:Ni/Co efflux regulator RcnB
MNRLILTTAMAALMAGAPIAAAWAFDGNRGRGGDEQSRAGGRDGPGPRFERPRDRGFEPRFQRPEPQRLRPDRRFEAPRQLRPGEQMPGALRDDRVEDYGRYRLRPPPHGYTWYRTGAGFMLVSPDGLVLDVID